MKKNILCMSMLLIAVVSGASTQKQGNESGCGKTELAYSCEQDSVEKKPATQSVSDLIQSLEPVADISQCSEKPQYPGGDSELMKFIASNLKYPVVAQESGTQGDVVVGFYVESSGTLSDIRIEKSADPSLDKEALRLVGKMPRWAPAVKDGQFVRAYTTQTIHFRLQ